MRTSAFAATGLAVLALGVAGCGSDDNDSSDSASTPASTPAAPANTSSSSTPAAPSGGAQTIPVGATEFKFTPGSLQAKSGEVTFNLKNNGGAPHALEIEGKGVEEETKTIMGGESATLKVNLKPGKYEFYCPVDGHRQQGMEGTLTVT